MTERRRSRRRCAGRERRPRVGRREQRRARSAGRRWRAAGCGSRCVPALDDVRVIGARAPGQARARGRCSPASRWARPMSRACRAASRSSTCGRRRRCAPSRPSCTSHRRLAVTRSATSEAVMLGGDPSFIAVRFARTRHVRPRSVEASRRKRSARARSGRSTTTHHVVPMRARLRTRPVILGRLPCPAPVGGEREAVGADHADPLVGRRDHERGAARQALAAAAVERRGRCRSTATGCRVGRRDVERSGRRDQDAGAGPRAPRAPHPGRTGVGAPDIAVLGEREQRVALGGDGRDGAGTPVGPTCSQGPGGVRRRREDEKGGDREPAHGEERTPKVTVPNTLSGAGRRPAGPRRRSRRPGSRCRARTASARTTCAGSGSRAPPGRSAGSCPSGPERGLQQRQRLVGRAAGDRQHVVERERLRVPAPPADADRGCGRRRRRARSACMRETTRPVSAGP